MDSLTFYEVKALSEVFNFADGHARYGYRENLTRLIDSLERISNAGIEISQTQAETEFGSAFFDFAAQKTAIWNKNTLYCPTASISIEIVANYLRLRDLSVGLIEPTFDNIADILKRHNLTLIPLREDYIQDYGISALVEKTNLDVVFLVCPNNPTGQIFSESDFRSLVEIAARKGILIIVDFSFRFFASDLYDWDQYKVLEESGVSYITIEDTGKTWSTFELKASPLLSDRNTFLGLQAIYHDMLLCTSPINLSILGEFISVDAAKKEVFLGIPIQNRETLRKAILDSYLHSITQCNVSVEWVRILNKHTDLELVNKLGKEGIFVLPGRYFFWNDHQRGKSFIRFSLMRDPEMFKSGMQILRTKLMQSRTDII